MMEEHLGDTDGHACCCSAMASILNQPWPCSCLKQQVPHSLRLYAATPVLPRLLAASHDLAAAATTSGSCRTSQHYHPTHSLVMPALGHGGVVANCESVHNASRVSPPALPWLLRCSASGSPCLHLVGFLPHLSVLVYV